jgi:hypothetical protein
MSFVKTNQGYCSPGAHDNYNAYGSCFSPNELRSIATHYNMMVNHETPSPTVLDNASRNSVYETGGISHTPARRQSRKKEAALTLKRIPDGSFSDPKQLIAELNERFSTMCKGKSEVCWLNTPFLNRSNIIEQLKTRFRPQMPSSWSKHVRQWLNTFDILAVMKQYEEKHDFFEFLGVFPVDFREKSKSNNTCIVRSMCNFNLMEFMEKGKTDFGMVINLDPHDMSGSHWVALYACFDVELKKFGMAYYDSTSDKPPKPVMRFMAEIYEEMKLIYPDDYKTFRVKYNPKTHQFKNTECGMFSMIYLIHCLEHRDNTYHFTRNEFVKNNMYDDNIWKMRKQLYVPPTTAVATKPRRSPGSPKKKLDVASSFRYPGMI